MAGAVATFPVGFNAGLTLRNVPALQMHSGRVFWVSNSNVVQRNEQPGSDSGRGDFNRPFATLNYALTQCTANQGDIIFVKPGHAETISAAGGVTMSASGTSVIGLGTYNTRPKFTFGTLTSATFLISGSNCFVTNLWCTSALAAVVTAFQVTGAGNVIDNIRFTSNSSILDFLTCITGSSTLNAVDGLTVGNCNWTTTTATDLSLINFAGTAADVTVWNNHMNTAGTGFAAFACSNLINIQTGKILTNADIGWNRVWNAMTQGEVLISCDGSTNTGFVHNNYVQCQDTTTTIDLGADVTGFGLFQNKVVTTNALSGFLLPAADVNL